MTTTVAPACRRHAGQSFLVTSGAGEPGSLHLVAGRSLRLRFLGSRGYRWTRPTTSRSSVVTVGPVVRCPHGTLVALVHAHRAARSILGAVMQPFAPDPPSFGWRAVTIVSTRPSPIPPVPPLARLIHAGGVLAYPACLVLGGANEAFTVPHAACMTGRTGHATIGMFGVKRTTTPAGRTTVAAWSAGVTIACTGTTRASYTAEYTAPGEAPVHKPISPGDWVNVSTSGADCPSLAFFWGTPGTDTGQDGIDDGCASGTGERNHTQTLPVLLFGGRTQGQLARPLRLDLRGVWVNASPLRMMPHALRARTATNGAAVTARPVTASWYRFALTIT